MEFIGIAAGGALGALCRCLLGNIIARNIGSVLPWGTFVVNIAGCFFMGALMTLIVERQLLPAAWRLFLCVGFLGGFTTFSSFGYEGVTLLLQGKLAAALGYIGASSFLGLVAVGAGVLVARAV